MRRAARPLSAVFLVGLFNPLAGMWRAGRTFATSPTTRTLSRTLTSRSGETRAVHVPRSLSALSRPDAPGTRSVGDVGSPSFRLYFLGPWGEDVSPWHDLPLWPDRSELCLMVVEIPKMTTAKLELALLEKWNPILQDQESGNLRHYHGPIYWNYGFLPRTWEDPSVAHPSLGLFGDGDPVDVVEIGSAPRALGERVPVKVLGALGLVDDGDLDWKIIAIAEDDPLAARLHDVVDVEVEWPELIADIRGWFRWYKVPDGKPLNTFVFGGKPIDRAGAMQVIEDTHAAWGRLRVGDVDPKAAEGLWLGAF